MARKSELTLGELLECVDTAPNSKLPTHKQLRENGTEYLQMEMKGVKIIVYQEGYFVYDDGSHTTVQRLEKCREAVYYNYQNGQEEIVTFEDFKDQPFYLRLTLEGERRLETNQNVRYLSHTYSYDDWQMESSDLEDESDFTNDIADREEILPSLIQMRQALKFLTTRESQIINEYFCENNSESKIAKKLGCSKTTVGNNKRAAIKKLKGYIEKPNNPT